MDVFWGLCGEWHKFPEVFGTELWPGLQEKASL